MSSLERAWRFDRDLQERVAERVVHFEQGAALFNRELPRVYDANFVRIDAALAELTADDAVRLAEALQGGLGHRKLLLPDSGARLAWDLEQRGWSVTPTVVMAYEGPPRTGTRAELVDPRAIHGARLRAFAERDRDTQLQITAYTERVAAVGHGRVLAGFADGQVAAFCVLLEAGGAGQIDEVTTLADHRRRGLGTAVVEAAIAASLASGNDLTYLVADANGWPRRWYERLGFRAIGKRFEVWRTEPF